MSDWERDHQLLTAWRGGDKHAGEELVERHLDAVARFFLNKINNGFDDLIQQTFLALIEGRDRIRTGTSVRAYLLSTAHRVLCSHLRKLGRGRQVDLSVTRMVDLAPGASTITAKQSEQRLLLAGLRQLSVDHQIALELAYWEGLNAAQIAEVVGISHSAMRSRLVKARQLLDEAMKKIAESPEQLHHTMTNFDQWVAELRAQLDGDSSSAR